MPPLSKPHATWNHGLDEKERERTWKIAAGSNKTLKQHYSARETFTRNANEAAALAKKGIGLTKEDDTVLKRRQDRLSTNKATKGAWREKPGNRAKCKAADHAWYSKPGNRASNNANNRAWLQIPENHAKQKAASSAANKKRTDALQAERAADFKAKGVGLTTEFGLGDVSRSDEVKERVHDIMHSSAGIFQFEGEATCEKWAKDHGDFVSIEEVLATGEWAAYFLVTKQKITPGEEITCRETTDFMSNGGRNPLMRIDTVDNEEQRDLRLFTRKEARTVVLTYILAKCVSGYDATSLEGGLQRYIEKEMGMPHGFYLHKKAGAAPQPEYGSVPVSESTWVALSLIRVTSPTFADVDPVDPNRSPPLTSCKVTSHDGNTTYNVVVRGDKQKFPDTKSVLADEVTNVAYRLKTIERRNKRKADAISTTVDEKVSV